MTTTLNWPRKPLPFPEESLTGYLNRFAQENGMTSRRQLLNAIDFPLGFHVRNADLPKLAALLGLEYDLVAELAWPDPPDKAVQRRSMLRARGEAVCPECLNVSPYSRQLWSHRLATCCPTHGHRLIDRCGVCGGDFRHDRWRPSYCECGADLRQHPTIQATEGEKIFSRLLLGQQPECCTVFDCSSGVPADIDLFVIGLLKNLFPGTEGQGVTGLPALPQRVQDLAVQLMPVFNLLAGGMPAMEKKIQELVLASHTVKSSGPAKRFGRWYWLFFKAFDAPAYSPWRNCAAAVISRNADILMNARTRNIQSLVTAGKGWMSIAEAARILNISSMRLQAGIEAGLIRAQDPSLNSTYRQRFLSRDEVDRLKHVRDTHLDDTAARHLLNVPLSVFDLMRDAGWLVRSDGDLTPPVFSGLIQKPALDELIERLRFTASQSPGGHAPGGCLALGKITPRKVAARQQTISMYEAIAAGSLRPIGHDGSPGVGGLLFSKNDIDLHLNQSIDVLTVTIEQVCVFTGAHRDAVKGWIMDGLLPAKKSTDLHGMPWQIKITDLLSFLMNYSQMAHLAVSCGTTSRRVSSALISAGIMIHKPSSGRGDLVRQTDLIGAFLGRCR